ncbi:O-antigen ligase family protein [Microbacterium sp. Marseille-Q6965]|uniref:O-antigen ligase family protein n=1 Tax=Microbacterium sp. Marseille-Q6965 TaxID=2965072 RepID=UPI0021B71E39|nr:O-antigen ligase family protein [Microbacterium sp. Marseille-Q6965]
MSSGRPVALPPPVSAAWGRWVRPARTGTALTMITVYVVLLFAVPSNLVIAGLGSMGRPAMLWGLVLLLWWVIARLQAREVDVVRAAHPVRWALAALLLVALVSFAAAMLRGQPHDQIGSAVSAIARLLSWTGVVLVMIDGLRTLRDVDALLGRIVVAGTLVALLGLAQFVTNQTLLDVTALIPGVQVEDGGVIARGEFTRPTGTATHPLEHSAAICSIVPLAITMGVTRAEAGRGRLPWTWLPAALIVFSAILSVSRSSLVGLAAAIVLSLPALPAAYRVAVAIGAALAGAAAVVVVPGLYGTIVGLFLGIGSDPSTESRTDGLARIPEFLAASPVLGVGLGTFLPRYYIFDNQWALLLLELGVLGALAAGAVVVAALWGAVQTIRRSPYADIAALGRGIAAALGTTVILFAFFDGLSFPISAGMFFLLVGLAGAVRAIGRADESLARSHRPVRAAALRGIA